MRGYRFALLALLLATSRVALADEAGARAHFKKGIEFYDKKSYVEALSEFQEAYREKPSAGIKQNIALCLKGLNRPADAATSFDEALDEGKDSLKPETRTAIERELADLSKTVATVNITIAGADEKKNAATVVSVTPAGAPTYALQPGIHRRPIRLMPGIYTFSAKIPGQVDPEPKKLALVTGAPVDATFGSAPAQVGSGTLTVRANVHDATIKVDGAEVGKGTWTGPVTATKHKVEVVAPNHRTAVVEVEVPANGSVESPVTLQPGSPAPGEYVAPTPPPPPKPKHFHVVLMGAAEGTSYRFSGQLGEATPGGERRGAGGVGIGVRLGYRLHKLFAIELLALVGQNTATYKVTPTSPETDTEIGHWQLTPMLRFNTAGKVRFTAATGVGLHGLNVNSEIGATNALAGFTREGTGVAASWLTDAGIQIDIATALFLELVAYADLHGVGPVDSASGRLILDSPAVRGGARIGFGIPF